MKPRPTISNQMLTNTEGVNIFMRNVLDKQKKVGIKSKLIAIKCINLGGLPWIQNRL